MKIDKNHEKALNLDDLLPYLIPISELGKIEKNSNPIFKPGDEDKIVIEYQKLKTLIQLMRQNNGLFEELSILLKHIENIKNSILKSQGNTLELFEIYEIKSFTFFYNNIKKILNDRDIIQWHNLKDLFTFLDPENKNVPSFHISNKFSEKISKIRDNIANLTREMKNKQALEESKAASLLQINNAKEKIIISRYQKNLIEKIEKSNLYLIEEQNFANKIYKIKYSDKIINLQKEIQDNLNKLKDEEFEARKQISKYIANFSQNLIEAQNQIGKLDWLLVRANFACKFNLIIPKISTKPICIIEESINLPIAQNLEKQNIKFQKITLNFESPLNIITGANMAGKTSILKTLGQFFYLVSLAIPLPAKNTTIGLIDFIFFSSTTPQSHRKDLSSFGAEIALINSAIKQKGKGLLLIDELARGTNPEEGNAFSRAVLEQFIDFNGLVVSATHFDQPAKIKKATHFRVKGITDEQYNLLKNNTELNLEERIKKIHLFMNYQPIPVKANSELPKAALIIAEILGIDNKIINRAKELLNEKKF